MQLLLGIDVGTSSCKVTLFSLQGKVVYSATSEYPVYYPHAGWAEQNPQDWWKAVAHCLQSLWQQGASPGDIVGIGVDGQSWSAILIDDDGQTLGNTPIWTDTRAQRVCDAVSPSLKKQLFELSGNPFQPSYTLPKLLWYKEHQSEMFARARKVLQSNSYIVYQLTGQVTQDYSQGYGLQCFDMSRGVWDMAALQALGLDPALLPDLYPCHQVVGTVHQSASAITGLLQGTPVVAGGLDAACGTLGAGVVAPGQTQEQGGQAGGMSICTDVPLADERLILGMHVVPGRWLLQGGTVGGGGALRWFEQQLGAQERSMALEQSRNAFEVISDEVALIPPGSEGVIFLPYMAGERSPIWNPNAKGVFYGLSYQHTRAHMARSVMEGTAYALKHNLEVAAQAGARVARMHAMGGAANSRIWTQIKADVTGAPIDVPASDTATTLGAALLAGVGVGAYNGFESAVAGCISVARSHEPQRAVASIYEQGYYTYRKLYEQLKPIMDNEL